MNIIDGLTGITGTMNDNVIVGGNNNEIINALSIIRPAPTGATGTITLTGSGDVSNSIILGGTGHELIHNNSVVMGMFYQSHEDNTMNIGGSLYIKDVTWLGIGTGMTGGFMICPTGPTGPTGPAGPTGIQGPTGPTGAIDGLAVRNLTYCFTTGVEVYPEYTNGWLAIGPTGTGFLSLTTPDGSTAGGICRGTNAVDLQIQRDDPTQVALGAISFIGAGRSNYAGSTGAFIVGGEGNFISFSERSGILGGFMNIIDGVTAGSMNDNIIIGGNNNEISNALSITRQAPTGATGTITLTGSGDVSNSLILGGTGHELIHNNSVVMGLFYQSHEDNTMNVGGSLYLKDVDWLALATGTTGGYMICPTGPTGPTGAIQGLSTDIFASSCGATGVVIHPEYTDGWLTIGPTGAGFISATIPDLTIAGGNCRGVNAIDWQIQRAASNEVASGDYSGILAGRENRADGSDSIVVGGRTNRALGDFSFIGGGRNNTAVGNYGSVVGGRLNNISSTGQQNTIIGGANNVISGTATNSCVGGTGASASHSGSFVWSDNSGTSTSTIAANTFVVRCTGGSKFCTDTTAGQAGPGPILSNGDMDWQSSCDRNLKTNITEVDENTILSKLDTLKIYEWSSKANPDGARHVSPMAQEFHEVFQLGDSNTRIMGLDLSGISLASIKGLHKMYKDRFDLQEQINAQQQQQIEILQAKIEELSNRLA